MWVIGPAAGPFSSDDMLDWFGQNYFPPELQIACSLLPGTFHPLNGLIALLGGEIPFAVRASVLANVLLPPTDPVRRVGAQWRGALSCGGPDRWDPACASLQRPKSAPSPAPAVAAASVRPPTATAAPAAPGPSSLQGTLEAPRRRCRQKR